jgi:hypothetical protein
MWGFVQSDVSFCKLEIHNRGHSEAPGRGWAGRFSKADADTDEEI